MNTKTQQFLGFLTIVFMLVAGVYATTSIGPTGVTSDQWLNTTAGVNSTGPIYGTTITGTAGTFTTIDTGQGANELYDMDQNVLTTSDVTFENITVTGFTLGAVTITDFTELSAAGQIYASDWIVTGEVGTYIAYYKDGTNFTSASFSELDGWVMGNATNYETIVHRGSFDVDGVIELPQQYVTIDNYGAYFILTADVDAMYHSYNYSNTMSRWLQILGGVYYGDKSTRSDGSAFAGCFKDCTFVDLKIIGFEKEGMDLQSYTGTYKSNANFFSRCWFGTTPTGMGNKGGGVLIGNDGAGGSDNEFNQCFFINNGNYNIKVEDNCHNNRVVNTHFAGTAPVGENDCVSVWLYGDTDAFTMTTSHMENVDLEAFKIEPQAGDFSDRIKITSTDFYQMHTASNNVSASIYVNSNTGDARLGTISDCFFMSDSGNKPAYAIWLDGADSDYWIIDGVHVQASGYVVAAVQDDSGGTTVTGDNYGI